MQPFHRSHSAPPRNEWGNLALAHPSHVAPPPAPPPPPKQPSLWSWMPPPPRPPPEHVLAARREQATADTLRFLGIDNATGGDSNNHSNHQHETTRAFPGIMSGFVSVQFPKNNIHMHQYHHHHHHAAAAARESGGGFYKYENPAGEMVMTQNHNSGILPPPVDQNHFHPSILPPPPPPRVMGGQNNNSENQLRPAPPPPPPPAMGYRGGGGMGRGRQRTLPAWMARQNDDPLIQEAGGKTRASRWGPQRRQVSAIPNNTEILEFPYCEIINKNNTIPGQGIASIPPETIDLTDDCATITKDPGRGHGDPHRDDHQNWTSDDIKGHQRTLPGWIAPRQNATEIPRQPPQDPRRRATDTRQQAYLDTAKTTDTSAYNKILETGDLGPNSALPQEQEIQHTTLYRITNTQGAPTIPRMQENPHPSENPFQTTNTRQRKSPCSPTGMHQQQIQKQNKKGRRQHWFRNPEMNERESERIAKDDKNFHTIESVKQTLQTILHLCEEEEVAGDASVIRSFLNHLTNGIPRKKTKQAQFFSENLYKLLLIDFGDGEAKKHANSVISSCLSIWHFTSFSPDYRGVDFIGLAKTSLMHKWALSVLEGRKDEAEQLRAQWNAEFGIKSAYLYSVKKWAKSRILNKKAVKAMNHTTLQKQFAETREVLISGAREPYYIVQQRLHPFYFNTQRWWKHLSDSNQTPARCADFFAEVTKLLHLGADSRADAFIEKLRQLAETPFPQLEVVDLTDDNQRTVDLTGDQDRESEPNSDTEDDSCDGVEEEVPIRFADAEMKKRSLESTEKANWVDTQPWGNETEEDETEDVTGSHGHEETVNAVDTEFTGNKTSATVANSHANANPKKPLPGTAKGAKEGDTAAWNVNLGEVTANPVPEETFVVPWVGDNNAGPCVHEKSTGSYKAGASATPTNAESAALLKLKLKEALKAKKAFLQKKLAMSKLAATRPLSPTTAIRQTESTDKNFSERQGFRRPLSPITAIRQLESSDLYISGIKRLGPEHLIRFRDELLHENCSDEESQRSFHCDNGSVDRNAEIHLEKDGLVELDGEYQPVDEITTRSDGSTDRILKKRKLDLNTKLAEARLKKSRLEVQQKESRNEDGAKSVAFGGKSTSGDLTECAEGVFDDACNARRSKLLLRLVKAYEKLERRSQYPDPGNTPNRRFLFKKIFERINHADAQTLWEQASMSELDRKRSQAVISLARSWVLSWEEMETAGDASREWGVVDDAIRANFSKILKAALGRSKMDTILKCLDTLRDQGLPSKIAAFSAVVRGMFAFVQAVAAENIDVGNPEERRKWSYLSCRVVEFLSILDGAPASSDGSLLEVSNDPLRPSTNQPVSQHGEAVVAARGNQLKKRNLELKTQLAEARLKKARLEQNVPDRAQPDSDGKPLAVQQNREHSNPEMVQPNADGKPLAVLQNREELMRRKKILEFQKNVVNLKTMVSKQEVLIEEQQTKLAATKKACLELEESLEKLMEELESTKEIVDVLEIREKALEEMEQKTSAEVNTAKLYLGKMARLPEDH